MADNKNKNPDEFSFKLINPANERFLGLLERDIPEARDQLKALLKEFNKINKAIASTDTLIGKLSKGLVQTAKSAFPIFINGVLGLAGNIVDIQTKIGALITVFKELSSLSRELKGLDRTLSLETAIFGTEQLAANVEIANQSILKFNRLASNVKTIFASAFDPSSVNAWAGQAVRAYADVEDAAYRLSTITVSGQERAIDAVSKNIKNMRLLQKATNDALGSVELLNAQYDIASAGFTGQKENLQVGSAAVNLSQAGYGDLAGSTNALVKALRALGEGADNAEQRAAQLFETTKVGLLTLDQLSGEVGPLSVLAKNLGVSFEEIMASLAGMTTQGLNTAEASTRLINLLNDIANGAKSANEYLANFRDEAGKPIQINARVLAEKGLAGVLEDLETATKGQVSEIQKIFRNKTSQEGLRSLLSLGTKDLKSYTERLEQVDTEGFKKEARNRVKTLYGSFQAAFNKAQKPVEEFGEGFGEKIVEGVLESNKALDELANKGATTFGKIIGNIQATANKIGVLIKSFMSIGSAVMGIVALNYITKKFVALIKFIIDGFEKLGQLSKESIIQNLQQAFVNIVAFAKKQIDYLIEYFIIKWQEILTKIKEAQSRANQQQQQLLEEKPKILVPASTSANQNNTQKNTQQVEVKPFTRPFNPDEDNNLKTITVTAVPVAEPKSGVKGTQAGFLNTAFNFDLNNLRSILTKNFVSIAAETKKTTIAAFKQAGIATTKAVKYLNTPIDQVGKDLFKLSKQIGVNTLKLQKQAATFTANAVKQGSTFLGQKLRGGLGAIGNVLNTEIPGPFSKLLDIKTPGKTFFGKTSNLVKDILKDTVSTVSKMTALLGVAGVSMSILSGWASAFSNVINKNAVPGVQAIRDSLAEIKEMSPEITGLFNSLDPNRYVESNKGGQYSWADAISSALTDISWRWGQVTGKGVATSILKEKAKQATDVAESTYQKYIKTGALTAKSKLAVSKVNKGLALNSEDMEALRKDAEAAKKLKRVEISALEERLANGNYSATQKEALSKELTIKKLALENIDKEIDAKLNKLSSKALADTLKNKRLDLPINFVVNEKTIIELESRIENIGKITSKIVSGNILDSNALNDLSEDLAKVIADLAFQVEADPGSVDALEQQLKQVMENAGTSLGDFIASDPKIREIFNEYLRIRTEQQLKQTDLIRSSKSSKFAVAKNLIDSPALAAEQLKVEYEYITAQINILNKELQESSISLTRQLELTNQIKQLDAERARLNAEVAVKQFVEPKRKKLDLDSAEQEVTENYTKLELDNKEAQLSIEQKILDTRKNLIDLTSQENQFTLINLTQAKERLDIAKAEYEFKSKQIQLEAEIAEAEFASKLSSANLNEQQFKLSRGESELKNKLALQSLQTSAEEAAYSPVLKLLDTTNLAQKTIDQNKPKAQATATSTVIIDGQSKQNKSDSKAEGITDEKTSDLKIELSKEEEAVAKEDFAKQQQYTKEEQKLITNNLNKIISSKFKNPWLTSDAHEQYKIYKKRIKENESLKAKFGLPNSDKVSRKLSEEDIFNPDGSLRNEQALQEYLKNNYNPNNAATIELIAEKRYKATKAADETREEFIRQRKEAIENENINSVVSKRFYSKTKDQENKNEEFDKESVDVTELKKEIELDRQINDAKEKALKIEKLAIQNALKNQQTLNQLDQIFGNFAETIELNRAIIEQEFALREAIIKQNEGLTNSFSSLGSSASSLNSRLGSALTNLGYSSDANKFNILTAREKTQKQITAELDLYRAKNKIAQDAVKTLEERGASESQLEQAKSFAKSSEEALRLAETQAELNLKMVDTQTSLKLLEYVFKTSSIKIEEALNSATDQVDIFKQQLDLIQSNQEVKLNYNSARTDLLQALTGLLGNSQGARAISARFNIDQIDDDTSAKISQSRIDAAKEYLDNQLLQQQIQLEQQAYDNALTQTQLLEDLVKVSSGQQATNITSDDLKSRLQSIPSILSKSIENANKRLNLAKQQETAIIANQETKESAIRLSAIANKLNILGGVGGGVEDLLNPLLASAANYLQKPKFKIEELPLAIGKSDKFIPEDQKIKPETINKSAMFAELKNLPAVINDLKTAFTQDLQKTGYNSTSINANTVVNISNHYATNKNTDLNNLSQLKNEIITYVNQAITAQMQALSRKVYEYARNS